MISSLLSRLSLEDEGGAVGGNDLYQRNQNDGQIPPQRGRGGGRARYVGYGRGGRRGRGAGGRGGASGNEERAEIAEDNLDDGNRERIRQISGRGSGRHRGSTQSLNRNVTRENRLPSVERNGDTVRRGRGRSGQTGRGRRNQDRDTERQPDLLNFGRMRNYENKDSTNILLALGHEKSGLNELVNLPRQNPDMVKLAVSVIAKGCTSHSARQNKINILSKLSDSPFLTLGIPDLLMSTLTSSDSEEEKRKTLNDICEIILSLFFNIPAACISMNLVGITSVVEQVIDSLRGSTSVVDEDLMEKLTEIIRLREKRLNKLKSKGMTDEQKDSYFDEDLPPDDFREMQILPTMEDLDPNASPFLRKNKINGGYSSINDYLDVQFRLLREDFIQPLRNGVSEYQKMAHGDVFGRQRITDIRVYTGVSIMRSVCSRSDLLYRLQFDTSKLKRINWKISKRLIYGSLVCLSADDFRTFYIATVGDRDANRLKEGMIDVKFEHDLREIDVIPEDQKFIMVETTAFFEAYRHVLRGLQLIRELPFKDYIVHSISTVNPPNYLRRDSKFDLRPLVNDDIQLRGNDENLLRQRRQEVYAFSPESRPATAVTLLDELSWPNHELLHLDRSQFAALQTALTKEFSVIQGPPGTGKTYVGLKIVKALLHNSHIWNRPTIDGDTRPMLIVCYTNHALDQFLEGIVKFYRGKVIRIGGRISSTKMEEFSLRHWRKTMKEDRRFREYGRIQFMNITGINELQKDIEIAGQRIEAAKGDILTEDELRPVMSERHQEQLSVSYHRQLLYSMGYDVPEMGSVMPEWLGIAVNGAVTEELIQENEPDEEEEDGDNGDVDVDVEDEGNIMTNNRLLDTDDFDNELDLQQIIRETRKSRIQRIAFDVTNFDKGKHLPNDGFQLPREARRKLKKQIRRKLGFKAKMDKREADNVSNIWRIDMNARWRLYRYWVSRHCQTLKLTVTALNERYENRCEAIGEVNRQKDKLIMSQATIIAMTTTGAARYHNILQEVNPRIIVVEEAAEVLEGHIITSLTQGCEQLILIGDHKQLRPNPNVYQLATKYNLQVSLFERMLQNGVHCDCLEIQHRMRPEISRLMKPIYPTLQDHDSVKRFDNVMGLSTNIYFIDHKHDEQHDDEIKSHSNEYEAQYLHRFADYLLKQGYNPNQITILTAYSGQLFQLKKLMPKKRFEGMRITPVDNFQGEENDIILLSLVRSNPKENIGFLKIDNRVCVALSRARKGLYVIGNFEMLASQSKLWKEMTIILKQTKKLGEKLLLKCQNHPEDPGIEISKPGDFEKAPLGGCTKLCNARLGCGHSCTMNCHPTDHEDYECQKPCPKRCKEGHPCRRKCYQDCGDCKTKVKKVIPSCGHTDNVSCYLPASEHKCTNPCDKILDCNHKCGHLCGFPHQCTEVVKKKWLCGHSADVKCTEREYAVCRTPCEQQLECGHTCRGTCSECHSGRLHKTCQNNCSKMLICDHKCQSTCSNCLPCKMKCENQCRHSKCKKECGEICAKCEEQCTWRCQHYECSKKCHEPCDRPPCNQPCNKLLKKCKHPCIGLCGEPCPKLCRICDREAVTEIFFGTEDEPDARFVELKDCGHVLEYEGLDTWMNQDTSESSTMSIQLKACPKCKTPIRKCVRYGTIINRLLQSINEVKQKYIGNRENIERLREDLMRKLRLNYGAQSTHTRDFLKLFSTTIPLLKTENELIAVQNQMEYILKLEKHFSRLKKIEEIHRPLDAKNKLEYKRLNEDLVKFLTWLSKDRSVFSDQEVKDAQAEFERLSLHLKFFNQKLTTETRQVKMDATLENGISLCSKFFESGLPLEKYKLEFMKSVMNRLEKLVPASGLGISEDERVMIVKAMELSKGHWYKCKNGHPYAIGDCGGAMEESKCPTCQEKIGGYAHRLVAGNAVATEMDGAQYAAWSEQANMANYRFDDIL